MSKEATSQGLSERARSILNTMFQTSSSEEHCIAEFLDEVASNGDGQESDQFLVSVARELKDVCTWFIKEIQTK